MSIAEQEVRPNKGFHPILERDHPYTFVDACMQAWPDADFANAHRHGANALAVTAWRPHDDVVNALEGVMFWHLIERKYPNVVIAWSADDVRAAKINGQIALIISAQGGDFIANKIHRVEAFHRLGLRMMLFAYNASNAICDGALDRTTSGLTRFGRMVVAECNRLGVLIDCTHVGEQASLQIIDESAEPVIFSHSNANTISPSLRNISDEQILACVQRGGVIGLAPFGPLVMKPGQETWPSVNDFIDHIDHVVQLTGTTDSVAIGTDMSIGTYGSHEPNPWGEPDYPDIGARYAAVVSGDRRSPKRALCDFNSYAHIWTLVERLMARGYTDHDIHAVLGQNLIRVFDRVWH